MMRRIAAILASTLVLALLATDTSAVGAAVGPNIRVGVQRNDDLVTGVRDRRLIFSEATSESDPRGTRRTRVRNIGDAPLNVTLTISDDSSDAFDLSNTPSTFTLAPNAFQDVFVDFDPPSTPGKYFATLNFNSNDPNPPSVPVLLRGINALGYEEANEPTLKDLLITVGFTPTGLPATNLVAGTTYADEIRTNGYFRPGNANRRTMLLPLARYTTIGASTSPPVSWYPRGAPNSRTTLHSFPGGTDPSGGQNQRLLPTYTGGAVFRPGSDFGIHSAGEFSDPSKNDPVNTRNLRFFRARSTASGNARNDIWIITQDIGSGGVVKNNDYNDNVWLLVNAVPALP
jgi:hypothetical protein